MSPDGLWRTIALPFYSTLGNFRPNQITKSPGPTPGGHDQPIPLPPRSPSRLPRPAHHEQGGLPADLGSLFWQFLL